MPVWMVYNFPWLRKLPLGMCWDYHGNFFVEVGKTEVEMARLKNHINQVFFKRGMTWVVLYPEGAILPKYLKKSQEFAQQNGYPVLKHASLPRVPSVYTICDTAKTRQSIFSDGDFEYVIDVTMAWAGGIAPRADHMLKKFARPVRTHLLYRVFKFADFDSSSNESVRQWLYRLWVEKESVLERFYKTGELAMDFPKDRELKVVFTTLECLFVQAFWWILFTFEISFLLFLLYSAFVAVFV